MMTDSAGAFVPHEQFELRTRPQGALSGLTFAAKDLFDVEGRVTGAGNPRWKETHEPAANHAEVITRLLNAGATLVGKTITDELAYALSGLNYHYGTPRNGAAPDRVPGGSSSGSASAVSNHLCDFAIGTDSGGSVRVPASYCGLFGIRPTHGRIPLDGCSPLASTFDTCGWFARSASVLECVGLELLAVRQSLETASKILVLTDFFRSSDPEVARALTPALDHALGYVGSSDEHSGLWELLHDWHGVSVTIQAFEAWQAHGRWVEQAQPIFGPDIRARFENASKVSRDQFDTATRTRKKIAAQIRSLMPANTILCFPTAPTVAPPRDISQEALATVRRRTLEFCCVAGLAGFPQISIPQKTKDGLPCALSFVAVSGGDEMLLKFASDAFAKQVMQ